MKSESSDQLIKIDNFNAANTKKEQSSFPGHGTATQSMVQNRNHVDNDPFGFGIGSTGNNRNKTKDNDASGFGLGFGNTSAPRNRFGQGNNQNSGPPGFGSTNGTNIKHGHFHLKL